MFTRLGWTPAAGETDDRHEVRAVLVQILGEIGEDPEVVRHSAELATQYSKDVNAIDPSLVRSVLEVAAMSNDPGLFQQYMAAMSDPKSSPEQLSDYSRGLDRFSDPKLTEQWLERIVGPETRSQDAAGYLGRLLENPAAQKMAWAWTKQHWTQVAGKLTAGSGSAIVNATSHFCSADLRNEVEQFFTDHRVAETNRSLKQSVEMMNTCIHFQADQQPNLTAWLEQHAANASAGAR
jgi:aminopeptidase N/puromycin-sensitive aminopeptidase